ncbi:MAG TPA: UDP-N-acetylmuramoyl-L-alanine--D-glutamate ligase [Steroidobacteraceae bacterium]|nr:UDP-N-acetylmuramoyl-L-alanine--D-glutamate ligase [Steroidobacteraceae bacterium]
MNAVPHRPSAAVIAGIGRTGLSCAAYLRERGWRVALTDTREAPPELERVRALDPGIAVRLGGLDTGLLQEAVCVIASPGLPLTHPFFNEARRRGLDVIGDIELFALAADAPVVGITGTNGKSTVTTLLGRMAERAGVRVRVGGNLGEPALDLLAAAQRERARTELYVLELSSFQLEATRSLDLRAAVVLNVSADHLDRYASLADYAAAKARIFERCETAVLNVDDPLVRSMPRPGQTRLSYSLQDPTADYALSAAREPALARRGVPLLAVRELKIRGLHNIANALAALALGEAVGLELAPMLETLRDFTGLPHRTQWVAEVRGVTYINDSKATNVGATLAAVAGLPGPLVVIAGGDGKQQDFAPLAPAFRDKVRHAVLIGRDREALARALEGVCTLERCETLPEAVRAAARAARPGDTVLLSPACASLDMFRDYAQRGSVFTRAVEELAA